MLEWKYLNDFSILAEGVLADFEILTAFENGDFWYLVVDETIEDRFNTEDEAKLKADEMDLEDKLGMMDHF